MMDRFYMFSMFNMMSRCASACQAEAASSCSRTASHTARTLSMDAIFVESIIICALLVLVSVLGLCISLLAVLLVLVIGSCLWVQRRA